MNAASLVVWDAWIRGRQSLREAPAWAAVLVGLCVELKARFHWNDLVTVAFLTFAGVGTWLIHSLSSTAASGNETDSAKP